MRECDYNIVSVIIPAFNAATFLRKAVDSAIIQGRCVAEIIIVDNMSTDDTSDIIDELVATYGDIIVPTRCEVQGPAAARNHGIRMAKGEWVQFLDADDYLYAGKVSRQLGLVGNDIDWVIGTSDVLIDGKVKTTFGLEDDLWKGLVMSRGVGHTNANLFRKSALLNVGVFNEDMLVGQDYYLYFKLLKANTPLVRDLIPGSVYVQHDGFRGDGRGASVRFKFRLAFVKDILDYLRTHRSAYLADNLSHFNAAQVCALRMYMTGDAAEGRKKAAALLPSLGRFKDMETKELPGYWRAYSLLGFAAVETLRVRLRSVKRLLG